jgi:two-component system CheB/CheR fusion protein
VAADGLPFPVVAIGASAGGLEAFRELLGGLSPAPRVAILFALHGDRTHPGPLPELLAKATHLPVREVAEGMAVKVDHVYLVPPSTGVAIAGGRFALRPDPPGPARNMPIDRLFRTLAAAQKGRAVGVLLSGGTDGTLGLEAIKAEGGITFARHEAAAAADDGPRAAARDGCVDHVLAPRDIARQLERLAGHAYARGTAAAPDLGDSGAVAEIVGLLRARTHVDFAHYKQTTVQRRILRRMALRAIDSPADYARLLRDDDAELRRLYQDFLIRVTRFFRDPDAFEALKEKVFPSLFKNLSPGNPLRVWVAGCSTGEEVYSLAICVLEYPGSGPQGVPVKILATDLSESALETARAGLYSEGIEADVSPERLRRFFCRGEGHYQINKAIRDLCVFSRHDIAGDPPFGRIDLVSCRNVLIYMDVALQRRVLPVLHYALKPDGFLFLGSSETVGPSADLFAPLDARHHLYVRKEAAGAVPPDFKAFAREPGPGRPAGREEGAPVWSALDVQREADRLLLARYAPVGVVVDEAMTVLQFRGRTAPYLESAPGLASLNLFRMLREGLAAEVRAALLQARTEDTAVTREGLRIAEGAAGRLVRLEVLPFRVAGIRFFLVLFRDQLSGNASPAPAAAGPEAAADPGQTPGASRGRVETLEQEIAALRASLQSVLEEQESTTEELKSANEEILSANEQLQSTNEELQTAQEEAQSANEELATVNEELRRRNGELAAANNDLSNVLDGLAIPIVMVGRDLRVRRFTPPAGKLFNLAPTDTGRPIGDARPDLRVGDLTRLLGDVIDNLEPYEGEVRDGAGRRYALRIRPYATPGNRVEGASIVLLDIDRITRNAETPRADAAGREAPPG